MLDAYRGLISTNAAAKAVSFLVSYATVIILNAMLTKDVYGEYVFFVSIFGYLAILGTLGFDKLLVFRLSQYTAEPGKVFGGELYRRLMRLGVVGTALVETVFLLAWWLFRPQGYDYDLFLIAILSINTLLTVPLQLGTAYLEANKRATVPIMAGMVIMVLRIAVLAFIHFGLDGGMEELAIYFILPTFLHLMWYLYYVRSLAAQDTPLTIGRNDARYSLNMMFTKFSQIGIENINILVVGAMLTSYAVAEYSVAAKVAMLVAVGNELLAPLVGPRMKYQMEQADPEAVRREYAFNTRLSTLAGVAIIAILVPFGAQILELFGDYGDSYPVLLLLAVAFFNQVAFGPNGRYLALKGYSGFILGVSLVTLFASVAACMLAVSLFGLIGAAWASLLLLLLLNLALLHVIYRLEGMVFLGRTNWAVIVTVNVLVSVIAMGHYT